MKAATKAGSKAAKLRAKRTGRPRKSHADRFPCGKIKHAWSQDNKAREQQETEKEAISVATAARARIHGIEENTPLAGYVLGRLFLDKKINDEQRKAGDEFAEAMGRYYRLTGIPFPSARAQSISGVRGSDGDVSESQATAARRASNMMMHLNGVLLKCKDGPQVRQTVFNTCIMGYDVLRAMPDSQLEWLRRGLNALLFDKGLRTYGE